MTHDDPETGVRGDESELPPNSELWKKINNETEMLRRRTTPMHVQQRILSSLPDPPSKTQPANAKSGLSPALIAVAAVVLIAVLLAVFMLRG